MSIKRRIITLSWAAVAPYMGLFNTKIPYLQLLQNDRDVEPNDILYFGGGTDVNPEYYNQPLGKRSQRPDRIRDIVERGAFMESLGKVGGFIGICRGAQFLTVMNGGKLIQDVTGHGKDHFMETYDQKLLWITSTHHQMMYPWNLPKEDYQILGWNPYRESKHYLDGWNKPVELPEDFVEPEIIWYPKTRCLCIQGHPEYLGYDAEFCQYSRDLIRKYLFGEQDFVPEYREEQPVANQ
jgi:hypothetical protein